MLGDAAHDGAVLQPIGYLELQQLLHLGHGGTFQHGAYADVQLVEVLDADNRLHGVGLVVGGFVGFLRGQQLVHLSLDGGVINLLEQQDGFAQLMAFGQEVGMTQVVPLQVLDVQHLAQLLAAEGQEGLEGNGQVGYQLQGDVQDGAYTLHIRLGQLPRLGIGQVFVADARQVHGLLLRVAELEDVQQLLHLRLDVGKVLQSLLVVGI